MSRIRILIVVLGSAGVAYGAVSAYIVSASLTASHGICEPTAGPPRELPAEAIAFNSRIDGTRLAGWLVSSPGDRAVILIHGIDSDAWAGAAPDLVRAYSGAGFDVFLFDLRGHGQSGGGRITLGKLERGDVATAVDLLLQRGARPGRIGLHGTSYGAAMALLAAAELPQVGAVVADSAYADVRDLMATEVARRTRVPAFIAGGLMRPGIETAAWLLYGLDLAGLAPQSVVAAIAPRPVLFIHGSQDPVIPPDHSRRLVGQAANAAAELWILDGMGHTEGAKSSPCYLLPSPGQEEFLRRIVTFFEHALGGAL